MNRYSSGKSSGLSTHTVFFFQAEDGIRDATVTGVQTCALPIYEFSQLLQRGVRLWKKVFQILKKRGNSPEKHPRVPMIATGSDVLLRELQFGFLREAANGKYGKAIGGEGFTHALYVTKSHFRPRRRDAKYHHSPRFTSHV